LVGLCPGPAVAALFIQPGALMVFIAGMAGGMVLTNRYFANHSKLAQL